MLQTVYKLNLKPKTILELKRALQQIRNGLPQTLLYRLNAFAPLSKPLVRCKNLGDISYIC